VHKWLHRYAAVGLRGLADRSSRPDSCPHQMVGVVEARVIEMRREHPGWGPRTIRTRLGREGVVPLPGRSSILSSSRSPSWPARSRSRLRARSSGSTPSATTVPRSTAPSPRRTAGPVSPELPDGLDCQGGAGVTPSKGYRDLTTGATTRDLHHSGLTAINPWRRSQVQGARNGFGSATSKCSADSIGPSPIANSIAKTCGFRALKGSS
jgi:hypothetical protein